ncbi:efflux RND transporter periplasmic adaptor subunit [Thermoflexus sp.]|uniref:efflux RND transporter periplasmic adaptor subunit n=1 Tax=Thermoflexus sp. TaxID=1969742 RepID=UPI002ADD49D0|nr:efflux RND transporter periplasmic adaptor subunit [Thermoflexus sp.]
MRSRRWLLFLALMVPIVIGAWALFERARAQPPAFTDTATIRRGTLRITLSAAGKIRPRAQAVLNFATAGTVAEILVREGETVRKGQPLARLDTTDLELAVRQAEIAYLTQQTIYSQTVQGPKPEELAAARAAVRSAQAALQALEKGPDPLDLEIARLNVELAKNAIWQAQLTRDKTAGAPFSAPVDLDLANARVGQAELQAAVARLQYEKLKAGARPEQLEAARAQLAQAQASLARLQPDPLIIERTRLQLEQARLQLEQARRRLEQATLVAPFDGTIAALNIEIGQVVGPGVPGGAILLADLSDLYLDLTVDEVDVVRLKEGMPVAITLDALPGRTFRGHIESIDPAATEAGGAATYRVRVVLDEQDPALRSGMSATVEIEVDRRENVLLVPNAAVRRDRTTGRAFVNRVVGDRVEEVEIRLGAQGETESEVLEGLREGDIVALGDIQPASVFRFFGPRR